MNSKLTHRLGSIVLLLSLCAATPICWGQTKLVRAARYLDVQSGNYVSPAVILINGESIEAINPNTAPDVDSTIDLGQATLLPGLIDMHTHLCYSLEGDWSIAASRKARPTGRSAAPTMRGLRCWPDSPRCAMSGRPGLPTSR